MNIITIAEARKIAAKGNRYAKRTQRKAEEKVAAAKPKRRTRAESRKRFMLPLPAQLPLDLAQQRGLFERHDHAVYSFRLPMPPQVNNAKAVFQAKRRDGTPVGHPRIITTAEARAYFDVVTELWRRLPESRNPPLTSRVRLLLTFHFRDRRRQDLSNRIKVLEDALTNAGVWGDDSQVDDGRQLRGPIDDTKVGYVDVVIESMDG